MAAAFLAGGINSVAGGGTLITFPALLALGVPPIAANATSTVAIWPGSIGSAWGFRRELRSVRRGIFLLIIPTLLGGTCGALLLRMTPAAVFAHLVPFLILLATVLFTVQAPVQRHIQRALGTASVPNGSRHTAAWRAGAFSVQFAVGVYGGYFGAGMSIMLLTVLAFLGMDDILQMNGVSSLLSLCANGVASLVFASAHMVVWSYVGAMMGAALFGGWAAAGVARRVGKRMVRHFVIVVGFTIAALLFVKMF
ncbi:hypothetical protein C7378_0906 [Acidipila rosea]|uniref:Probable membrane transporter protein n=2 Tax=Acidipila rosea TaxID=768535 RepID=A0A4R1LBQ2_9BACT|nr:hypothetical protein C7378_0906 [Acidipila rosea]